MMIEWKMERNAALQGSGLSSQDQRLSAVRVWVTGGLSPAFMVPLESDAKVEKLFMVVAMAGNGRGWNLK